MAGHSLGIVRRGPNFVGSYRHIVDSQGRVQLPRAMRRAMTPEAQNTLIISRGLDGCLWAYPLDAWQRLTEQWEQAVADSSASEQRHKIRLITSQAAATEIDSQGRISVAPNLLKVAGIRKEAMIVGSLDRIELWDPKRFERAMVEVEDSFEQNVGTLRVYRLDQQAKADAG